MNKIETGSEYIFRYDNCLDISFCNDIANYVLDKKQRIKDNVSEDIMPWHDNDSLNILEVSDLSIVSKINYHRYNVQNLIMLNFKSIAYINFTVIVS